MKKVTALVLSLLMILVAFAACGPKEKKPDETTPEETTPAETAPKETTPAETTPAETTPAETTPAEGGANQPPKRSFGYEIEDLYLELPKQYEGAMVIEPEDWVKDICDSKNIYNTDKSAEGFNYVYLKNPENKWPNVKMKFEVPANSTYGFCMRLMASKGEVKRTAMFRVDEGEINYLAAVHGDRNMVPEYWCGMFQDVNKGEHTLTFYLGDDFDNTTVKSVFLDKIYICDLIPHKTEGKDLVEHVWEKPENFKKDVITIEPELYNADGLALPGDKKNDATGVEFHYVYLKNPVGDWPFMTIPFEVAVDGHYEFCLEFMGYKSDQKRVALVQIDDGDKCYVESLYGQDKHMVTDYVLGLEALLKAGKHNIYYYLDESFDNATVKSLFLDRILLKFKS